MTPKNKIQLYILLLCSVLLIVTAASIRKFTLSLLDRSHAANTPIVHTGGTPWNDIIPSIIDPSLFSASTSTVATHTTPTPPPRPYISAQAYLVGNLLNGKIYLSHKIHDVKAIASISKLVTAVVVRENMSTSSRVVITQPMLDIYDQKDGIVLGEIFTVDELMYPLLLASNNDVAEGLAMAYTYEQRNGLQHADTMSTSSTSSPAIDESLFITKMNELAEKIGMKQSHFVDASGLSSGNVSTAEDLFTLIQYIYRNHPDIMELTRTQQITISASDLHATHTFISTSDFTGDPHFIGGKTGRTDEAGETMLSAFNYVVKGEEYKLVIIVLHSPIGVRQIDSERLYLMALDKL